MKNTEKPSKVLVIGSGPIVIGQAAEFDYAGTQACHALREEGIKVILVNSNPATIQTDFDMADIVYIEPLTQEFLERIIEKERPDALLPTVGGQTGLNLAIELGKRGILEKFNVQVIGTNLEAIEKSESREKFNEVMRSIDVPILPSLPAKNYEEAYTFAEKIGYPVILRPAFTLGGSGGGVANNKEELKKLLDIGFRLSATHEVLIEKSIIGWGEFEYEVIRDANDNAIIICNMENFDPMGVHTGESIVIAPSQTLSDRDHQILRNAALKIVRAIDIKGGCNVQFGFNHETGEFVIIEVNPRLSRSSALASKATGYPIARVATKIALGYSLNKIKNAITNTTAAFEPALDYCVLKIPKWPFEKFLNVERIIGTQMKSTGETMAIGRTFEEALQKAIRSLEIKIPNKFIPENNLYPPTDLRLFAILQCLRDRKSVKELSDITKINRWFLEKINNIVKLEKEIASHDLDETLLRKAKQGGFSDIQIAKLKGKNEDEIRTLRKKFSIIPTYKIVDSCAGEFEAVTPYYYSTYEQENEVTELNNKKIIVIGSGPIRIGQGIEFDYCCSHAVFALRELGIKSIMINNNPETVSTDFDSSDRLYFEPLTFEDVINVIENERPEGVILQLGGQTSINLAKKLSDAGVKILGTQFEGIDIAENRELFRQLLNQLDIPQPKNGTATKEEEAFRIAAEIGYPVVVRPSYVIAGRGMQIVYNEEELKRFITEAVNVSESRPVLIDKYLNHAIECEVDLISDGKEIFIGGIMEHIEFAGIHSGDANIVVPSINIYAKLRTTIEDYSRRISFALGIVGFVNIQYAIKDDVVYVLEANPRASRTVPFLSKVIGVPMAKIATKILAGEKIDMKKLSNKTNFFAVKGIVFPFLKLRGADITLGPEMKSTGETMGIASKFETSYYKALLAGGFTLPVQSGKAAVLISLRDEDKQYALSLERLLRELGFEVFATPGTAKYMTNPIIVQKLKTKDAKHETDSEDTTVFDVIGGGQISLIINTPKKGGVYQTDGFKIRRMAIERGIQCITNIRTALELVKAMKEIKENEIEINALGNY